MCILWAHGICTLHKYCNENIEIRVPTWTTLCALWIALRNVSSPPTWWRLSIQIHRSVCMTKKFLNFVIQYEGFSLFRLLGTWSVHQKIQDQWNVSNQALLLDFAYNLNLGLGASSNTTQGPMLKYDLICKWGKWAMNMICYTWCSILLAVMVLSTNFIWNLFQYTLIYRNEE